MGGEGGGGRRRGTTFFSFDYFIAIGRMVVFSVHPKGDEPVEADSCC